MTMRKLQLFILTLLGLALIGLAIGWLVYFHRQPTKFDGQRAYRDVINQVAFGPRIPDSQAHAQAIAYIQDELRKAGWVAQMQNTSWNGFSVQNIIASRSSEPPAIILGAHYDSRLLADQDPGPGRSQPVPGANDGASGVAVLLELARVLPKDGPSLWLVFFDSEDNGGLDGRDWIMGSRAFVSLLTAHPKAVVILDMIGDADLNIYIERNSNSELVGQIWAQAARLGYSKQFIPTGKYSMEDDHTPFLEAGLPAVDIIDFDYPYWHTTADTPDKVSPNSLQIVGETLMAWIAGFK